MARNHLKDNPELAKLFKRFEAAPDSHLFAPLADACRKAGLLQEAVDICSQGLQNHPGYSSGHVVMGKCLFDQGRFEDAKYSFQEVLAIDRENLVALKYLGMIAAERGHIEEASKHFNHILELDPDNREIREKLGDLELCEQILELTPIEDESFEGGNITLGEEALETSDELATMTLADIFADQGYRGKAIKIYEEVVAKDPGNEAAREKLRILTEGARDTAPESADDATVVFEDAPSATVDGVKAPPAVEEAAEPVSITPPDPLPESDEWEQPPVVEEAAEPVSITPPDPLPESGERDEPWEPQESQELQKPQVPREETTPKTKPAAASMKQTADDDEQMIADEKSLKQFKRWLERADR